MPFSRGSFALFRLRRFLASPIRVILAVLCLIVVPWGTSLGSVASAAPASAQLSGWPSWLAKPQGITCADGTTKVVPTSAVTDAYGVTRVHYAAYPKLYTVIPPRGFSAGGASQALLADLGIHVPNDRQGRSNLLVQSQLARDYGRIASQSAPQSFCMSRTIIAPPEKLASPVRKGAKGGAGITANHIWSGSWAGYTVDGDFTGVVGNWTVQNEVAGGATPNMDDTWIGIGGDAADYANNPNNYSLIQDGTSMVTNDAYHSWFEYVASNRKIDPTPITEYGVTFADGSVVRPGDEISSVVSWASSTVPCFTLIDESRASGSLSGCITGLGIPYDTRSIEWIDEDPGPGTLHFGNFTEQMDGYLADFDHTYWTNQGSYDVIDSVEVPFTSYSYLANIMSVPGSSPVPPCSSSGDLMAYPENASASNGGSSDNVWCHQGPN